MRKDRTYIVGNDMGISSVISEVKESLSSTVKNAALATLMSLPTAASANSEVSQNGVQSGSSEAKQAQVTRVKDAIENKPVSYNGLSKENLKNLIANIAYNETMTDYVKNKNDDNIVYDFLNMVNNRAGGDLNNVAAELSRKGQFSSFPKHVKNGVIVDDGFNTWSPDQEAAVGKGTMRLWVKYNGMVDKMMDGSMPNRIGNRNMLSNRSIDNKEEYEKWGKDCDFKSGSQYYGYQKDQDGYLKYKKDKNVKPSNASTNASKSVNSANSNRRVGNSKRGVHTVRKGDTLSSIARRYGTTVNGLAKLNGISKDSILRINQTIKY